MKQAYQITYAIDRSDNMIGQTALSLVGGAALAPVAEAGYLWAMRNPISAYDLVNGLGTTLRTFNPIGKSSYYRAGFSIRQIIGWMSE